MATNDAFESSRQDDPESAVPRPQPSDPPPPYQPSYGTSDAVPPPYSATGDPTDAPPSYESLFGELRAAKQSSSSVAQFLKKMLVIILSTLGCTICVAIILAIPISMIVIGAIYLHDCPRQFYIPIYLVVGGCFGVLKNLSSIVQRIKNKQENQEEENAKTNPFDSMLNCFLVGWFIAGNMWVYRAYNDVDTENPTSSKYCHPTLYWFAFWTTTAVYMIFFLAFCSLFLAGLYASFFKSNRDIEAEYDGHR